VPRLTALHNANAPRDQVGVHHRDDQEHGKPADARRRCVLLIHRLHINRLNANTFAHDRCAEDCEACCGAPGVAATARRIVGLARTQSAAYAA